MKKVTGPGGGLLQPLDCNPSDIALHSDDEADHREGEWAKHGGYMQFKKRKLLAQFDEAADKILPEAAEEFRSNIFHGIAVHVNGHTDPSADEIKRIMMLHGGQFHLYYNRQTTGFIIASILPYTKIVQLKAKQVVKPEWISESLRAGKLLPWKDFELYPLGGRGAQPQPELQPKEPKRRSSKGAFPAAISDNNPDHHPIAHKAGDPNYLNQYYARSRLHHLSLWKVEAKQLVERLQEEHDGTFPGVERLLAHFGARHDPRSSPRSVIMHIDFDCFFVSVGLLSRPHLAGKPVACCHGKSGHGKMTAAGQHDQPFNSKSEVASCNYEARKKGLKNGMYLGPAKQLCPELVTIPYEFEEYKRISTIFYQVVAGYTLHIEAISCDEMLVDCTQIIRDIFVSPEEFAGFLRQEIFDASGGCHASAGLSHNPLLARLATKKAKPNGHLFLEEDQVSAFLVDIPIRDLPGVGYSAMEKFHQLNAKTCGDLSKIPLSELKTVFGQKIGQKLHNYARGMDDRGVFNHTTRKSVSAEINYGMRMTQFDEFKTFFEELSREVETRLHTARVRGQTLTLKLLLRHPDAPVEPEKFMGCGHCTSVNKSVSLVQPTDSAEVIAREGVSLFRKLAIDVKEVRGIGVQVTRLVETKKRAAAQVSTDWSPPLVSPTTHNTDHFVDALEKTLNSEVDEELPLFSDDDVAGDDGDEMEHESNWKKHRLEVEYGPDEDWEGGDEEGWCFEAQVVDLLLSDEPVPRHTEEAVKQALLELKEETECWEHLNYFQIPEVPQMLTYPWRFYGATMDFYQEQIVTRHATRRGKSSNNSVKWAFWRLNAPQGAWFRRLKQRLLGRRGKIQSKLKLVPVTASQYKRQMHMPLKVRGANWELDDLVTTEVKEKKIQTRLIFPAPCAPSTSAATESCYPSASQVDPEFLAALPAELLEEVYEQYAAIAKAKEVSSLKVKKLPAQRPPPPAITKRKSKKHKRMPNQPSISSFARHTKSQESVEPDEKDRFVLVVFDSDGTDHVQADTNTTPIHQDDQVVERVASPVGVALGLSGSTDLQPVLSEVILERMPDEAVAEAIVDWCADQLRRFRLSVVERLFNTFYREVDHLEWENGRTEWVEEYHALADRVGQASRDIFGSSLRFRQFAD
ncbi:DNA repair protein REV1 [Hypsibius exemplaris]|uniref:DNA repair protein REV1 n=1 Tax=Hypsibius exemplaris TaxID=2072580 RepID=A0A1W0X9P3_HYPEX|nr:DNA repair protein REV1 [Hypsibius exemplaris]